MRIGQLIAYRKRMREQGKVIGRMNHVVEVRVRVMSNVAKPWWGKQALTRSIGRD